MKKLPTKNPNELFKTELPPPELKKVDAPLPPKIKVSDISIFDYVKLWLVSWIRNEAKDELNGKHSPLPFDLKGGLPAKTLTIVSAIVAILMAVSC